ncbi:hypothetical protein F2Q69_00035600 [Brassica cretica]|uniref:Uncharacterized protein n=2 Tax=Brassica cretica TaxID=69181 RepID=A0A3N6Q028_BRACR|nr:hypothetical protein DY000_02040177 [Brassica cretica]KAF3600037.1 hypothetical protein F2Q69_00035600 [Brassica cretica]
MVRTFFGNPGGKKNKLPIRRTPSVYVEPTIPNSTEIGRPVVVEEGVHNEEEIQNGEEIQNEKETDGGNRVNEEAIAELDSSSSVEGDDCELLKLLKLLNLLKHHKEEEDLASLPSLCSSHFT